jgi:hypothetical protein
VELSVDIADNSYWGRDVDDIGLSHKHFLCLFANLAQQRLAQKLLIPQSVDARIEVEGCHPCACRWLVVVMKVVMMMMMKQS